MRSAISNERAAAVVVALALLGTACSPRVSGLRFANLPPVFRVDDRRPIPKPEALEAAHNADEMRDARAPLLHLLSVPGHVPARGVNALGEVPDSTWFENRIGMRDLAPEDVARGPGDGGGPVPPFLVVGTKRGGHGIGVEIEDAVGDRYLLKFDPAGAPELETAIDPVVQRLLWAAGYHVPKDDVVLVERSNLVVAEDAVLTLEDGEERTMTTADLDALLEKTAQPRGGRLVRALASELLEGVPIGGYPVSGVRPDDPNDRVPHELRRDIRGQSTFFAWLGHTDAKVDNTLDVWIPTGEGSSRGYVMHYLVDFGLALGAKDRHGSRPHDGYAYDFDLAWGAASLFTLGLYRRPWERLDPDASTREGRYSVETFDPARFRTTRPYVPFLYADRFDAYWASKILVRFGEAHIEAAVAQGRFSNPRTHARLVRAIVARKRRVARHGFREVAPIDHFRIVEAGTGATLCAEDLWLRHRLGAADDAASTRYRLDVFDFEGEPTGERFVVRAREDGHLCVEAPRVPARSGGYVMVRYATQRGSEELPPVVAHLAPHPQSGVLRVVGVERR